MTFIQFGILQFVRHGRIVVAGRLPEHLRSATASVVLRTGRRSCPGQLAPGGGFTIAFHSHKRLLWVAVWAVQPDGDETRVGRRLVVNLHAARSRTMLDEAGDMLALRAFTDIPARPCEAAPPTNPDSLSIHWIIPDFQQGAGGHMNIFRIVRHLQDAGHRNVFWIIGESRHADPADYIDRHFVRLDCPVNHLSADNLDQVRGDVVVATNCWSAYYVRGIRQVARKCYLVQDYEPWFFAVGSDYHLARRTYRFGFQPIVAGRWLWEMMRREGAGDAPCFSFAYDPAHYHPATDSRRASGPWRIAVYARITTDRRMVPLALKALDLLARRRSDFIVHFFGQYAGEGNLAYPFVDEGVLDAAALGRLYRQCDLGVVFSATNHSIVPTEMMACGLPVLELDGENNTLIYPPGSIALAEPDEHAVAREMERLLDSPQARAELRQQGLAYTADLDWETAARVVGQALGARPAR